MAFVKSLVGRLCLFSLLCSTTLAAPVAELFDEFDGPFNETELVKRNLGDQDDPIDATFNIANWPNIAEQDCYAMLCLLNANRVYQRVATANARTQNYRASGASLTPFQSQQLQTRHTSQINSDTVSAEEFPWESTQEGGPNAYVFPATQDEQTSQAGGINGGYSSSNVAYGRYFTITFTGAPFGTYCTALFANPPDTSVCGPSQTQTFFGTTSIAIANFVYQVVKGATPYYFIHAAGSNKGQKRSEDLGILARKTDDDPVYI